MYWSAEKKGRLGDGPNNLRQANGEIKGKIEYICYNCFSYNPNDVECLMLSQKVKLVL